MARLRIQTPESKGFMTGALARIWLNDMEISKYCMGVEVNCMADDVITATIHVALTELELEAPVLLETLDAHGERRLGTAVS